MINETKNLELFLKKKLEREIAARKEAEQILEAKSRELYFLNERLKSQRDKLDISNTEMQDSLTYSKRIQQSLLPSFGINSQAIQDHFIYYRPKDIVSGDFYWQHDDEINKRLIVATADCTGHGVPGAFMSIIGKQGLDLAVIQNNIYSPSNILHALNGHLYSFLQKELNKHIKDGMDISVYCIDYSDEQNKKLTYSGALNSIYIIRDKDVIELKADRITIGYDFDTDESPFCDQTFPLKKGDCIYSYTDGYYDQFGGPLGKKLKKVYLRNMLIANSELSMENQIDLISELMIDWKGELEQIDDMCIIGVRVN